MVFVGFTKCYIGSIVIILAPQWSVCIKNGRFWADYPLKCTRLYVGLPASQVLLKFPSPQRWEMIAGSAF